MQTLPVQVNVKSVSPPPSLQVAVFSSGLCLLVFQTGDWHLNQWNYTSQHTHINGMSNPLQHYGARRDYFRAHLFIGHTNSF